MKDKTRTLLTGEIQVTPFDESYNEIDQMMFLSKNLYNTCLYTERQLYFKKRDCKDPIQKSKLQGFISNFTLSKQLQDSNNRDYRALPCAVSQQVCKQVYTNYISFFSLVKKDPKARMPKYLHKTKGRNRLSFTKNAISKPNIRNGIIKLTGLECTFKLPDYIDYKTVQQIDIVKTRYCKSKP